MERIKIGTTDRTILIFIPDPASTTGAGKTGLNAAALTCTYTRVETDNDVVHNDVTSSLNDLSALTDAHNDWGLKEVSSTLSKGLYRLDIADAVFATGAWYAVVQVTITSGTAAATPKEFMLIPKDELLTPGAAGGELIAGSNAATTFATFTVSGATTLTGNVSMAAGLNITQSSANTSALVVTGNGTGHGAIFTSGSGATGDGLKAVAASTNGNGLNALGTGTGSGIVGTGGSSGDGIGGYGGASGGAGILGFGGATDGPGAFFGGDGNGHGADFVGAGTGKDINGDITGNLSGSVGSVTGNVGGNVAGSVGSVTGNVGGDVAGSVGSVGAGGIASTTFAAGAIDAAAIAANAIGAAEIADGAIDAGAIAASAITAAKLDADAITAAKIAADVGTELAAALLDLANGIETGITLRNAIRLIAAASAGKLSGAATTTVVIRNVEADSKDRITATVDADGNRSAVTLDLT